ncbi:MAG: DUF4293 family protein [Crocinitomix sp.]|nr:DUF4293 family protein [Crocinitomix sp.]
MIQRAQTIYLAFAFGCMVVLLFFPIFSIEANSLDGDVFLTAFFGKDGLVGDGLPAGSFPMSYIFIGLAVLTFACILLFKKRPRQLLLTRLNFILHLLLVIGVYSFYYFGASLVETGVANAHGVEVDVVFIMELGFYFLIPTLAFLFLAIRGIKRDENLVNSLDRIR